jgi:hypothetical protein
VEFAFAQTPEAKPQGSFATQSLAQQAPPAKPEVNAIPAWSFANKTPKAIAALWQLLFAFRAELSA